MAESSLPLPRTAALAIGLPVLGGLGFAAVLAGIGPVPPPTQHQLYAALLVLGYLTLCGLTYRAHRRKRVPAARDLPAGAAPPLIVAYASQTGFAEELARETAESLRKAGEPAEIRPLGVLDAATLAACSRALFVVSTTGEGDPPDSAARFVRKVMDTAPDLGSLRYALLALGDRSYARYCAFGLALDAWLRERGAVPAFDPVEVDDGDEASLDRWQDQLRVWTGSAIRRSTPAHGRWILAERRLLNPGSAGGPAFHLAFEPPTDMHGWTAGDIAEIRPNNPPEAVAAFLDATRLDGDSPVALGEVREPLAEHLARRGLPAAPSALKGLAPQALCETLPLLPVREYSIASIPEDGRLELLVRQVRHDDGTFGLGSGWLTAGLPVGGAAALRVRTNRGFHPPPDDRPMILIGNGTGLAGLRAHLKARALTGHRRNWLLFGERSAAHDSFHRAEIEGWQASGVLSRVDLAFSRDQVARLYVQHLLRDAGAELRRWVGDGAAIYVCGSLHGMAGGVNEVLLDLLGGEALARMTEDGRYRRDVY